jgi:hypothetical protein
MDSKSRRVMGLVRKCLIPSSRASCRSFSSPIPITRQMRSRENFVISWRTFNILDGCAQSDSSKRRSGVSPSLRSELASKSPGVSTTLCPSSSRTDRAKERVTGLTVIRTVRSCFTCTFRERHSVLAMWDESNDRLTFPDGQSFAYGSPTQQRDRASPMAVPRSSGTELRLWQSHAAAGQSFA